VVELEAFYSQLESTFPTIDNLLKIKVEDNGEPLVPVLEENGILVEYRSAHSIPGLNGMIYVRESVWRALHQAAEILRQTDPAYRLLIRSGYRSLEIQQIKFQRALEITKEKHPHFSKKQLRNAAHWLIAYPEVAGHPTGGAVDVTLCDSTRDQKLDMGSTPFHIESKDRKIYYATPEISKIAQKHRKILRNAMVESGFSPFDGEFWHFSLGDREWAYKHGEAKAHFGQLSLRSVLKMLKKEKEEELFE